MSSVKVTVYDATAAQRGDSLQACPRTEATASPDSTVADVLRASGHTPHRAFALVTPEVEGDVLAGEKDMIFAATDMVGVDQNGLATFPGPELTWGEFAQAVSEGLYGTRAAPTAIVMYQAGVAGGPDTNLQGVLEALFDNPVTWTVLGALGKSALDTLAQKAEIPHPRRQQLARQFHKQGIATPGLIQFLRRRAQWDIVHVLRYLGLSEDEAEVMLTSAGYVRGEDRLWRVSEAPEAKARQEVLARIESQHPG